MKKSLSCYEKISIYVPENVDIILTRDAWLFEVFKTGTREINRNRFLSMLTLGYFHQYTEECKKRKEKLEKLINSCMVRSTEAQRIRLCEEINNGLLLPQLPRRKKTGYKKLSLKPTAATITVINTITEGLKADESLSHFYCRMLISYCEKPLFERERIIFRDNYEFFTKACKDRSLVSFSLIWHPEIVYTAIPYEIATSHEEMMNYVLCQTRSPETDEPRASVFRLSRIKNPCMSSKTDTLCDTVADRLERMKQYAPQYPINNDDEICVRLNDAGEDLYRRMYFSRPAVERVEHRDDGHYYYFSCSDTQALFYFQRFGWGTAEIISPAFLREKMIELHQTALEAYES